MVVTVASITNIKSIVVIVVVVCHDNSSER